MRFLTATVGTLALTLSLVACQGTSAPSGDQAVAKQSASKPTNFGTINGGQAKELVKNGAILLDVRTPGEFSGGAIPGAKNIPVQDLGNRMAEAGSKDDVIVVYCRSGVRSAKALSMMKSAGYKTIYDLGAIGNW